MTALDPGMVAGFASLGQTRARSRPAGYLGLAPQPLYLLPLLRIGAVSALLTREVADLGWVEQFDAEMLSLEQQTRARGNAQPGRADTDELLARLPTLVDTRWRGREFGLASYGRYRTRWLSALDTVGARLLAPNRPGYSVVPPDKIAMRDWLRQLGVPTPAAVVTDRIDYPRLRRQLGRRFVAQTPRGSAGNGTYLITDEDSARALPASDRWLVSEYAGDTTLNVHGFLGVDGVLAVLRPSVQLSDVAGIGSGFGRYCGSDFQAPARLPSVVLTGCHDAMERIGRGLGELGYHGVFGVDFAVRGDTAAVLEINCRMQGSSWLLGEIELAADETPTMLRHVLARYGRATSATSNLDAAEAGTLTIRHTGRPVRVLRGPTGGVYRLAEKRLVRHGAGYGLLECGPGDCVLVNVPPPGTVLYPGATLARVVTRRTLTSTDGTTLNNHGRQVIHALHTLYTYDTHHDQTPESGNRRRPGRAADLRSGPATRR
jgi:hypothetical protein